ncbi:MAG: hypothetical protein LUQ65_11370 [Candidatus Helarchaeota archaeon]|nr:hypothetical protein [Candidatus Helarchaeota archaeon]
MIKNVGNKSLRGTNIPLMKISGNLIRVPKVIIFEVISVGGAAIKTPKDELAHDSSRFPKINQPKTQAGIPKKIIKKIQIIEESNKVKSEEARVILRIKSDSVIGAEMMPSRFFSRVSHGKMTGLIAVPIKNTAIPKMPLNNWRGSIGRPIIQAIIIKNGNNNPKMITGPFLKYNSIFFLVKIHICPNLILQLNFLGIIFNCPLKS